MKFSKKHEVLKKILIVVFVTLFSIMSTGTLIAVENADIINTTLGLRSYVVLKPDGTELGPDEYMRYYESEYGSIKELKDAGYALVEEVMREGAVLLKNDNNALPLNVSGSEKNVSLFGIAANSPVYGGTGSGEVNAADAPKLRDSMEKAGFVVNGTLWDWYVKNAPEREEVPDPSITLGRGGTYALISEPGWDTITSGVATSTMQDNVAVFTIGRVGGEGGDVKWAGHGDSRDGNYLQLNDNELSVLAGLKALKDAGTVKKIVVLINSANHISCDFLYNEAYGIDAALWIGSVGQTGLNAVCEILAGKVNPSGCLPDTIWMDNLKNPVQVNFGNFEYGGSQSSSDDQRTGGLFSTYVVYKEGIYLGYKYTETRYEDVVMGTPNAGPFVYDETVAYPFGYGLSYTTFEYSNMSVSEKTGAGRDAKYTVTVTVKNTGSVAGKEAVQVYLQKPYTQYDKDNGIEKAAVELVGYDKTRLLNPGESQTVSIEVPEYFFTSYDAAKEQSFIIESGEYYLTIGENGAHDAINNILTVKNNGAYKAKVSGNENLVKAVTYASNDFTTYKMAMGTGAEVNNLFDFADINRYEGRGSNSVTYYSRADWAGTVVECTTPDPATGRMAGYEQLVITDRISADAYLDDEDLEAATKGISAQFPTYGSTKTAYELIDLRVDENGNPIPFDDPMWDDLLDQLTYDQIAALCSQGQHQTQPVFEINKPQTLDSNGPAGISRAYSSGPNGYATVTGDSDSGLSGTSLTCNGILAATFNHELVEEAGKMIGEDGMWAGYSGIYGTGLNIHRSPYTGRAFEYFSEDSILTGLTVTDKTRGIQSKGIYVYNKHFVLNDQETNRLGVGTWANEQTIRENYLRAFELPIIYVDAKCVMSSFNRLGAVWSSACKPLMTDWLRGEAGMTGHAVTDYYMPMPGYMFAPSMIIAGNDLPDGYIGDREAETNDYAGRGITFSDYREGGPKENAVLAPKLRESAHRILYTVVHSRGMDGTMSNMQMKQITPWWRVTLNVVDVVLAIGAIGSIAWYVVPLFSKKKGTDNQ